MTYLTHREGNIFNTLASGVAQGVNTQGLMGAGIAKQFRTMFPAMYEEYKDLCLAGRLQGGGVHVWKLPNVDSYIFNIASQEKPGPNASYDFLVQGVYAALEWAEVYNVPMIAFPRIGSGIGGLKEDVVEAILETMAKRSPIDIELWTYKA